jgi:hypothetical protein
VKFAIVFAAAICIFVGVTYAVARSQAGRSGQGTIVLDTTELTIGMPRDAAMSRLAQSFTLKQQGNSDSWIVIAGDKPPYRFVGSVAFRDGRLTAIYKDWAPDGHTDVDLARSFYGLVASLESRGKRDCQISVAENQQPSGEIRTAYITCGDEYIQMDVIRTSEYGEQLTLSEVMKAVAK